MKEKRKRKDPDAVLFRESLAGVQPLKQDRITPPAKRPAPIPHQSLRDARDVIENLLSGDHDYADVETGEELLFVRPGLRPSVVRKLRRGQYAIQAELDLHGLRVPDAHALLKQFLRECRSQDTRCVRVVHGKGLGSDGKIPVLKGKLNVWLRRHRDVLAFCSARPNDGGTGAVYVLLKK
ncbi:MAG: Smr/MutS family protein [Acidiferrobacterales bacterium]|nr:Smr/MutS family protein [Acidiferrobacterales bacterium]